MELFTTHQVHTLDYILKAHAVEQFLSQSLLFGRTVMSPTEYLFSCAVKSPRILSSKYEECRKICRYEINAIGMQ